MDAEQDFRRRVGIHAHHVDRWAGAHPTYLRIGGVVPLSTTDYPDHLSAVVFCQGCPWRCGYCHNPHLLPRRNAQEIPWQDVMQFLARRRGLLDAVVFSGGEPTLQSGIVHAAAAVKALGFKVGLHTAGIYPRRLRTVLPLVDWVGMDVKAPFVDYSLITGIAGSGERALQSVQLILDSGVDYEFRTTMHPALHSCEKVVTLGETLAAMGVRHYALQEFRAQGCASAALAAAPRKSLLDAPWHDRLATKFESLVVRRASL